jgi:hypothetical protein
MGFFEQQYSVYFALCKANTAFFLVPATLTWGGCADFFCKTGNFSFLIGTTQFRMQEHLP